MQETSKNMGVAPFTGAWIEINIIGLDEFEADVAPFTGTWIEISKNPEINTSGFCRTL